MSLATDDTLHNSTSFPTPTGTIKDAPYARSKKAKVLDMSPEHRFGTTYNLDAVMIGFRGNEKYGQRGTLNGRDQISASETAKKGRFGNTDSASHGIPSTPAWGAAVRA